MIARDKKVHFFAGALAGFTGGWLAYVFIGPTFIEPISVLSAFTAGVLKEVYDLKVKKTVFDWNDVIATCIGGYASSLVWFGCSFLRGF